MGSPTQLDKYNFAVKLLATNKADHLVAATDAWQQNMRSVNAIFAASSGSPVAIAAYRKGADLAREAANLAQSQASVAMQNAQQANTLAAIAATRSKEQAAVDQAKYTLDMVIPNAEYADVMTDKKSGLEQRINAEAKLMNASNTAMEGQNLYKVATRMTEVLERMTAMRTRMAPSIRQREVDENLMAKAISVQSLDSLPEPLAKEALETMAQQLDVAIKTSFNEKGKGDRLTKDFMDAVANDEFAKLWSRYGRVDPDVVAQASTAIMRGLVDGNGDANPAAVAAILQYMAVIRHDPNGNVRELFLNDNARALAEAVIFNAGPGGDIAEAAGYVGRNLNPDAAKNADAIATTPEMEEAILKAVSDRNKDDIVGFFGALFSGRKDFADVGRYTPSERNSLKSDAEVEKQIEAVTNEVRRLAYRHKDNRPEWLVDMAIQNVKTRSAQVGANFVQMNFNIKNAMFGDRVGNIDKAGLVNQAIVEYLASEQMGIDHPGLQDVGFPELLMGWQQDALLNVPVFDINWTRAMSAADGEASLQRGVRPFRSYIDASGNNLFIEYFDQNGNASAPIRIDLQKAGALYLQTHHGFGPMVVPITEGTENPQPYVPPAAQ